MGTGAGTGVGWGVAVVWDFDGTLVDTRASDRAALATLVAEAPDLAAGIEQFWAREGRPLEERVSAAWPGREAAVLGYFDGPVPAVVHTGVRRAVRSLRARGVRQAVVSSRRRVPLHAGVTATGLADCFAAVVALEDVRAPKPDPEGLLAAAAALGVPVTHTVYVGDRDEDLEAAQRAGMAGWLAIWGRAPDDPIRSDAVVVRRPGAVLRRVPGQFGPTIATHA